MEKGPFAVRLIAATALALLAPAVAQAADGIGGFPKEVSCDLPTDRDVAACTRKQADLWDKSLNVEYKDALERVTEDSRPLLIKAQRLWVQFRDANCAVQFAQGGTVSAYYGQQCILNLTQARARELRMIGEQ